MEELKQKNGVATAKEWSYISNQSIRTAENDFKLIKDTYSIKKVFWQHLKKFFNIST